MKSQAFRVSWIKSDNDLFRFPVDCRSKPREGQLPALRAAHESISFTFMTDDTWLQGLLGIPVFEAWSF